MGGPMFGRACAAGIALLACVQLTSAQYLKRRQHRIPGLPDGKPNLAAPAPRRPDGKPDRNGIWNAADGRFLSNSAGRAGFDAPVRAAGAELYKYRQETEGGDR